MTRIKLVCVALGAVFGFLLAWARMSDPDVIRDMLLLKSSYLYLMMGSAVAVGFVGTRVVQRARGRALMTGEPLVRCVESPERRHVVGSVLFGLGWAIADACPGPIFAQLGQGMRWGVWTMVGVVTGVVIYARRTAPAEAPAPAHQAAGPAAALLVSAPE